MANKKVNFLITAKDNASKTFRTVKNSLKAINKVARPAIRAIKDFAKITGVATGALVLIGRQSFAFMDTLDKVSKKIGVSTEFLQKLRFAGSATGVSVEKLDMGLQRFARRVDEARVGTGEALGALKELGIQFNNTDGTAKSTEEIFMDVARAMSGLNDGGKELRLGFKLFDSEGVALINTMRELNEQFGIFEDLGLLIPQDAIDKSVDFRDNLNEVRSIINQVTNLTFAGLADELDAITTTLKEKLLDEIKGAGGAENFADFLGEELKKIVLTLATVMESAINLLIDTINLFAEMLQGISNKFDLGLDIFPQTGGLADGFPEDEFLDIFSADPSTKQKATDKYTKSVQEVVGNGKKKLLSNVSFTKALQDIFFPYGSDPFVRDIEDAINETGIFERKKPKPGTPEVTATQRALSIFSEEISTTEQMIADGIVDTIKTAQDAFTDFFLGSSDGFKKLAEDIKRNFVDFLVREFITTGLVNFLSDIFAPGTFGDRAISSILGRQTGGPLMAGQTALVGERGPEIITASQDMMVKPTNQVGSFATAGANVTFNINAMDTQGFDQLLTQRKNQIIAMVNQGLNQRGGSLI